MIVPISTLESETLLQVIQSFVLREGTDYGVDDISIEDKVKQVKRQLENGTAVLIFSEHRQSVNIMLTEDYNKMINSADKENYDSEI
jgi:uncharacterized protein YheU (UPF0270 family)